MRARDPPLHWRVWISGASSGIGEELARQLAARGCHLALFARRGDRLEELRRELAKRDARSRLIVQPGDVRNRATVGEAIRAAEAEFGELDVVILNAGIGDNLFVDRFDAGLVERITAVNYLGAIYAIEAALPGMLERRRGKIVGVSSIGALRGMPTAAPYCASKAALSTFLESLRIDLQGRGVQVITVSPGFVKTPLTDRNRFPMPFLQPVDVAARRIIRGIERGRREIHFPRRLTLPCKLMSCLPGGLYEWLMGRVARKAYHKRPADEAAG